MSKQPKWPSLGIIGETRILQQLFDPFSKSLVAHFFRELQDSYGVKSLYARHISEDRYHRITEETDKLSFEFPELSPKSPHLYVNVMETSKFEGRYHGYNWNSIRKINITSNEVVSIIENGDLAIDEPYAEGWVSQMHGVAADEEAVYCTVGLERKTDGCSSSVDYYLVELSLMNKKYEIITKLDGVFL